MVYTKQDAAGIEQFLDAGQVAELLGLSVATIRKWVLIWYIPYKKIGHAVRFSAREIQEWVKTCTVEPDTGQGILVITSGDSGGSE
jgi:excisionase family DNA binding protein